MSNRSNYNSIVLITTLSVYLGLVLAGGTAPVFAHSALTKEFDIRNEIVFSEDLDKNPDEDLLENKDEDFPAIFSELLSEIKTEISNGRIKTPLPENFGSQAFTKILNVFGYKDGEGIASGPDESNEQINQVCSNFIANKILRNAIKNADFVDLYNRGTKVGLVKEAKAEIKADKNDLIFEVSLSKAKAEVFADYLTAKYVSLSKNAQETRFKSFYENTKITSQNNQVFIVTRLPRAAIDSLLQTANL